MRAVFEVPLHLNGPALWPDGVPLTMLQQAHRDLGTPRYNTLYQGRKGGLTGRFIERRWFSYGLPPRLSQCFAWIDPAISKRTEADESSVAIGNVNEAGDLWVRWVWHGKVTALEASDVIYKAWQHYRPEAFGVEKVAYQSALVEMVELRHPEVPIEGIEIERWEGDKTTRHLSLAAMYEFGRITHHPSLKGSACERQLTLLPGAKRDDMADAVYGLAKIAGVVQGPLVGDKPEGAR